MGASLKHLGTILTFVVTKHFPVFVGMVGIGIIVELSDTFLRENAHVDLKPKQGEDRQGEYGQDDHVSQIFDRLYHGPHDCFET